MILPPSSSISTHHQSITNTTLLSQWIQMLHHHHLLFANARTAATLWYQTPGHVRTTAVTQTRTQTKWRWHHMSNTVAVAMHDEGDEDVSKNHLKKAIYLFCNNLVNVTYFWHLIFCLRTLYKFLFWHFDTCGSLATLFSCFWFILISLFYHLNSLVLTCVRFWPT